VNDQRSVTDQLRDLVQVAYERKMYDAADWIMERCETVKITSQVPAVLIPYRKIPWEK
jgi:hypothetical protein